MKYNVVGIVAVFCILALSAHAQNGTLSVTTYGAKCNGSTDDTAAFQSAASAAASSYTSTGSPVTITYAGNCVVNGSVSYGSGVHWRGYGTVSVLTTQAASPTFYATNADDVEWDHVEINIATPYNGSNPYAAGIGWFSSSTDSSQHSHVKITNCRISNSSWGISIFYNNGTGSLTDVDIDNSSVTSATVYSNFDGIHVGGSVSNVQIHNNTVINRGDAAISLTTESQNGVTYTLSQATIENNVVTQDLVGIDISGATNVNVSGNFVQATASATGKQNPAFRQIYYNGYPINIHTSGNYFEAAAGATYIAKIDPASGGSTWPALNSTFEKNTVGGPNNSLLLYLRGSAIFIDGNSFTYSGGTLYVDYYSTTSLATSNVLIGSNWWFGNAAVYIGGNASLIQNVQMAPQIATGTVTITNGSNVKMISY
jgi:Periplasmic copper-binding protein (NosD)